MKKHGKKTQKRAHPSPSAFGAGGSQDKTLVRATLHGNGTLTSSGGGVITGAFAMDPSVASGTDWADFSSTYDEFRVLGVRLILAPVQFGVAVNGGLMGLAFDDDSATNPASLSEVQQYATCRYAMVNGFTKLYSFTWWRPTRGAETAVVWNDVANPSGALGSIRIYASGLSASTIYYSYAMEFFVEFRGRR